MDYASKSDIVAASIRELIITGELASGEPLRQRDLAARFGVSPTPVREALRRLETEGLVDYDLHRGAAVVEASFGASGENFQIRSVLESLAARMAATKITDAELVELRKIHAELSTHRTGDEGSAALNRRFHFLIYEAARAPMLLALLRLLWLSFPAGPQVVRPVEESVEHHAAILAALEQRDPVAAETRVRDHIQSAISMQQGSGGENV